MTDTSRITRWVVLLGLSLATGLMLVVSLRGNFLYGYSLGQTNENRLLFAWANVGADVWKAFGLIAVSLLWRAKHRRAAFFASIAWLMCLLFGINSALGIYVQDRAALTGTRAATYASYTDAEKQLAALEQRLQERPTTRTPGEINAAIDAVLARPVVTGERMRGTVATVSQNCAKINARTKDACEELSQLRTERAAAAETEKLREQAAALRRDIAILRTHGGSVAPDPVGEFYAWATGGLVSVRDVGFGFPLFFALLIEVVSAFGPPTIAAYAEASRKGATSHGTLEPAMTGSVLPRHTMASFGEPQHVVAWIAARAVPAASNSAISLHDLYADYLAWCADPRCEVLTVLRFEQELDAARALPELVGKIRKFGDRYYGVGLVRTNRRAIAAARRG